MTDPPPPLDPALPPPLAQLPGGWRARVRAFDAAVDRDLDRLRGNPVADRVFHVATELGDFSVIWHMISAARGLQNDEKADEALRLAILLGAESALVNGVVKSFFRRTRPAWEQKRAYKIRKPRSSSFPSGHASSAFMAATLLSAGRPRTRPFYFGVAAVVATSRSYVRIHHASDVVGGAVTGLVLGQVVKRAWPGWNKPRR